MSDRDAFRAEQQERRDLYDDLERFWQARYPDHQSGCADDCGTCWRCGVKWAVAWSFAVLSNPQLADQAERVPPLFRTKRLPEVPDGE